MRLALYPIFFLVLIYSAYALASAATPLRTGLPFRYVATTKAAHGCGNPVRGTVWRGLTVTQKFQHCTLKAVISVHRSVKPTVAPTHTPAPIATATPYLTATPRPTVTPHPTVTPYPTPTPLYIVITPSGPTPGPYPTAAPPPNACSGGQDCVNAAFAYVNSIRTQYGRPALRLDPVQSSGNGSCVGSQGHSDAMAQSGTIWHVNSAYPRASFPSDICASGFVSSESENVGAYPTMSGDFAAIKGIIDLMMSEQHDDAYCTHYSNHACSILSRLYSETGFGLTDSGGQLYLTEDFYG